MQQQQQIAHARTTELTLPDRLASRCLLHGRPQPVWRRRREEAPVMRTNQVPCRARVPVAIAAAASRHLASRRSVASRRHLLDAGAGATRHRRRCRVTAGASQAVHEHHDGRGHRESDHRARTGPQPRTASPHFPCPCRCRWCCRWAQVRSQFIQVHMWRRHVSSILLADWIGTGIPARTRPHRSTSLHGAP